MADCFHAISRSKQSWLLILGTRNNDEQVARDRQTHPETQIHACTMGLIKAEIPRNGCGLGVGHVWQSNAAEGRACTW